MDQAKPPSWTTRWRTCGLILFQWIALQSLGLGAETFRLATYNVENYLMEARGSRQAKSAQSRAAIVRHLQASQADIVALQEIGGPKAIKDLRRSLKSAGLNYPYWDMATGYDTNIHVAVLSRFPFQEQIHHDKERYLLEGRRFRISRAILELTIAVRDDYRITLMTAHLKSRRPIAIADEAEMRLKEAEILRRIVDHRLRENPQANLVVLGDLNDVKSSRPIRAILGRGAARLQDTRPAERNGDTVPSTHPRYDPRRITWTHYYGKEDSYSRIDYILVSSGLAREWRPAGTYVIDLPNWGEASDHRPIVATFEARDK